MPRASSPDPVVLAPDEARLYLVSQLHAGAPHFPPGDAGARAALAALRAIQLDPLDPLGNNADLVALARVDGLRRGGLFGATLPGHAFEHFAKERCLLPASAYPYYRDAAAEAPWWRLTERHKRLAPALVEDVYEEIRAKGPLTVAELEHRGHVEPLDWFGWKGTGRATTMAVEVLWTTCRVLVCGRRGNAKLYDVPERALPDHATAPAPESFERWALLERVEAAGLLSRAGGAAWSMLSRARTNGLPQRMLREGLLVEVRIAGRARPYFAPAGFRDRPRAALDERMRILGPLDPLLWDRGLVAAVFGFDYVWEVYKPEERRRWGWYVCPLLHRGRLVGRLEGRLEDGRRGKVLAIDRVWREAGVAFDEDALDAALARHAAACGAVRVRRPRRRRA